MSKIRLTKISGDKRIHVLSTHGNRLDRYVEGYPYPDGIYPATPTVGMRYGVYNKDGITFRTSEVIDILSKNTFRTENSIYKWEMVN